MKEIEIKVEVSPAVKAWDGKHFYDQDLLPTYAHPGDSGFDFRANIEGMLTLCPGERLLIPTGIRVELPEGYEIQVRPRSGLALKAGITVLNTPGTVDSFFRGEIGVILINLGKEDFNIHAGERIAQGVVKEFITAKWKRVEAVNSNTDRGEGKYGSSGIN